MCLQAHSEPIHRLQVGVEESAALIVRCCARSEGQLVVKKPELPDEFQGNIFSEGEELHGM